MSRRWLGLLAAACAVWAAACGEQGARGPDARAAQAKSGAAAAGTLAEDERIAWMLRNTARREPFLADTSDMLPVLVSKLGAGQADPLAAAKTELARIGEPALPELRRFFERHYSDPHSAPRLTNALAAVAQMETSAVRDLLLRGLEHPSGSVRLAALRGMARHAVPEDWPRLWSLMAITGSDGLNELAAALVRADPVRAARGVATWPLEDVPAPLVQRALADLARTDDPEALARYAEAYPGYQGEMRARLMAVLARNGHAEALAELRRWLEVPEDPGRREIAANCLRTAGLQRELAPRISADPAASVRQIAALSLGEIPLDETTRAALSTGCSDLVPQVRAECLRSLVRHGDAAAENEALELLKGDKGDLEMALLVLRETWNTKPELARRAFEILSGLGRPDSGPVRVEDTSLWRALALVPLRESAEWLYARIATHPEPIQGLTAHRWFTTQIGNGGRAAAEFLRERWRAEADPTRRVDLVVAASYESSDETRRFLAEVLEDPRTTAFEILHAAERCVRLGPAAQVAPLLKRVALRVEDRLVRPALNNLLWTWYGMES